GGTGGEEKHGNKDTGQTAHGTGLLTSSAPSRGADLASRRDAMHQELARGGVRQNDASIPHGPSRPGRWISALGRERDRPAATELAAPHLSVARAEAAAARACHVVSGAPSCQGVGPAQAEGRPLALDLWAMATR